MKALKLALSAFFFYSIEMNRRRNINSEIPYRPDLFKEVASKFGGLDVLMSPDYVISDEALAEFAKIGVTRQRFENYRTAANMSARDTAIRRLAASLCSEWFKIQPKKPKRNIQFQNPPNYDEIRLAWKAVYRHFWLCYEQEMSELMISIEDIRTRCFNSFVKIKHFNS